MAFVGQVLALIGFGLVIYGFVINHRLMHHRASIRAGYVAPWVWGGAAIMALGVWLMSR